MPHGQSHGRTGDLGDEVQGTWRGPARGPDGPSVIFGRLMVIVQRADHLIGDTVKVSLRPGDHDQSPERLVFALAQA